MKKIVVIFILIVFILIAVSSKIMLDNTKNNKENITKEISKIKDTIKDTNKELEKLNGSYTNLKEEVSDKLEEYEIWNKAKEKITEAL